MQFENEKSFKIIIKIIIKVISKLFIFVYNNLENFLQTLVKQIFLNKDIYKLMGGGLIQLIATGSQDKFLISNSELTFIAELENFDNDTLSASNIVLNTI